MKKHNALPNVIKHVIAVSNVAKKVYDNLAKKGIKINKLLVIAGALLHDIGRGKEHHTDTGYKLVKSLGYPEVAMLVKRHSLAHIDQEDYIPKTVEEKIVFYADKRVIGNKVVSIEERIIDIKKRYNIPIEKEMEFTKKIEKELMIDC